MISRTSALQHVYALKRNAMLDTPEQGLRHLATPRRDNLAGILFPVVIACVPTYTWARSGCVVARVA
ncbi:MAG: hypothetical protein WD009_08025 [Phycisphaeraceae bacterium]